MGFFKELRKVVSNPVKAVKKVVVGGVSKIADDFLGIDDSGGIVGSVSKIGEKVEDGLREAVDELDKIVENPYIRLAVSIAYPPAAPYLNAYSKLDSGEELNAADIAAIAASAGQDFGAFEAANIDPEVVNNIKKGVQVATADNPGQAFLLTFGTDVAEQTGFTDAFDSTIADTFGQDTLDVLKQNEDYIVDSARFASGNMSEQELVAKYGAGAVDYATSGTALEDYNQYLTDAINVGVGNTTLEETIANRYGEDIVNYLGADTPNQKAIGLGGLTTATQLAMGVDPADAAYAGTKRAYDEGARLEDLTFVPQQIAGLDFSVNDIVSNLGLDFPDLKGTYDLPSLAGLGVDLGQFNITAPDVFELGLDLPEVADLGVDLGKVDFSGVDIGEFGIGMDGFDVSELEGLADMGVDVGSLDVGRLDLPKVAAKMALAQETIPGTMVTSDGEEIASLAPDLDFLNEGEPTLARKMLKRTFA